MLQEILWLDGGDTIIGGTGMQNQYNYVTLNWTLFLQHVFMPMCRHFEPSWRV